MDSKDIQIGMYCINGNTTFVVESINHNINYPCPYINLRDLETGDVIGVFMSDNFFDYFIVTDNKEEIEKLKKEFFESNDQSIDIHTNFETIINQLSEFGEHINNKYCESSSPTNKLYNYTNHRVNDLISILNTVNDTLKMIDKIESSKNIQDNDKSHIEKALINSKFGIQFNTYE